MSSKRKSPFEHQVLRAFLFMRGFVYLCVSADWRIRSSAFNPAHSIQRIQSSAFNPGSSISRIRSAVLIAVRKYACG